SSCSPALDAGLSSAVSGVSTDLLGQPRLYGGGVDLGAYELQAPPTNDVVITSQPTASTLACPGSQVSVSVAATGSGSLRYQWYKDGRLATNAVAGQTSATLSLPNVQASTVGSYSALVTGSCGQAWSNGLVLSLAQALTLVSQPTPVTAVQAGTTVSVSVSAVGSGPLSYQWYKGGVEEANAVTGQTSATLSLANVQPSASGRYSVVVRGYCNQLTSSSVELRVVSLSGSLIYVTAGGSGDGSGSSWSNALAGSQLASAVNAAPAGTSFWIGAGTYRPSPCTADCGAEQRAATFRVAPGVALYGGFAGSETSLEQRNWRSQPTVLSGDIGQGGVASDNSLHVVTLTGASPATRLDGLVIQDGNADGGRGGGVLIDGTNSSPTLVHCRLQNNRADRGGGLYVFTSSVSNGLVEDCQFVANQVQGLGGAYYGEAVVANNSPQLVLRFVNCVFQGNSSSQNGGAVGSYSDDGSFDANETLNEPLFVNCLFAGNTAVNVGGAVFGYSFRGGSYHGYSRPRLVNCTVVGNTAGSGGGITAVWFSGNSTSTGSVEVTNSIVWGNVGGNLFPAGLGGVTYSLVEGGWPGTANQGGDPRFVDAGGGNYQLSSCSPALDAGLSSAVSGVSTDLLGQPRLYGGGVDLGAYELQTASSDRGLFTVRDGNWDDPSVWSCGRLPAGSDSVKLRHTITIPPNFKARARTTLYETSARLVFTTGAGLLFGQ
ncbi:immunoglobulin domain-containing protein, partial [uncultured Spirosoma sp.]|uniref:immunoglobulin domain-containing protein n=1 Tax=uncultured Spirosoma sp. TaxID=278208 RepID=UPI00258A85A1